MAPADRHNNTSRSIPLSKRFVDPVLRTAFRRAVDSGIGLTVLPPDRPRTLDGGAVAERVHEEVA